MYTHFDIKKNISIFLKKFMLSLEKNYLRTWHTSLIHFTLFMIVHPLILLEQSSCLGKNIGRSVAFVLMMKNIETTNN